MCISSGLKNGNAKDQGYSVLHLAHGELKVIIHAVLNCVMWIMFKIDNITKTKQKFCTEDTSLYFTEP